MPRPRGSFKTPAYCLHKRSGNAYATIDGREFWFGRYGTPESRAAYDRKVAEWLSAGRRLIDPTVVAPEQFGTPTVAEALAAFWTHACGYYVQPDGSPAGELDNYRCAMKPLRRLYGPTPAADFGPRSLDAVRTEMIRLGWCRNYVNRQVKRIVWIFKWAASQEILDAKVAAALATLPGLRKGKSRARETERVRPVAEEYVAAIKPHVSRHVFAMAQLQLLTGARSGELCITRTGDIDTSGKVWIYRPATQKTEHHGHAREIRIGRRGQAVLAPFLKPDLSAYVFSPRDVGAERHAQQRADRRTPVQPSQVERAALAKGRKRRRAPGERYTPATYRQAIQRACERAYGMPDELRDPATPRQKAADTPEKREARRAARRAWHRTHLWHPHQVRHTFATRIRRDHGIENAKVLLGQTTLTAAQVYAEADARKAEQIIAEVG